MSKVVVTRHPALLELFVEIGLVEDGDPIISHASPEEVSGKDVIGVLPLSLAALTESVTEVPMNLPPELRGQELTLDQVRQHAGSPVTYRVTKI